jgi:SynChlorMet cassette radical SAM/SPASM protein ScmE
MNGLAETRYKSSNPEIMRTPRSIDLEITSRCNLRCRYCYYYDNPAVKYQDLSTEEWRKFFDELGRCSLMNVSLAGGEPFFREDLPELLRGIIKNRMRFSIISNGTLIEDGMAAFLADSGRCDYVQVSIDGSTSAIHDSFRGKGTFNAAIRGIRTLQRHGVNVTVRVTIHRKNVHDLEDTASLLLEDLGLEGFSTNSAGYLGTCGRNAEEVMLTTQERSMAMTILQRLSKKYNGRISAQAGPLAEAKHWALMEAARSKGAPPFSNGSRLTGCGCTIDSIAVRADGIITPCNMLPHMELGRINKDKLTEVWLENPALNRLRRRHLISLTEFEFCDNCPYIPYCTGNCPALAYSLTGEVNHPSPDACLRRFLKDGGTLVEAGGAERGQTKIDLGPEIGE